MRRFTFVVVAAALVAAAACGSHGDSPTPARAALFVAGDATLVGRAWQDGDTGADFKEVVRWCAAAKCRLSLGRISESSATGRQEVVDFAVPADAKGDPDAVDAIMQGLSVRAMTVADAFFGAGEPAACSDVVGAITSAAGTLRDARPDSRRLVLFSGGFQTCPPNLLSAEGTDAGALRLIEQLRANRLLPDLSGVEVWMVGAGRVRPGEALPPPERVAWVQRFWNLYFEKAGARLVAWGPRLDRYSN